MIPIFGKVEYIVLIALLIKDEIMNNSYVSAFQWHYSRLLLKAEPD